MATLNLYNRLTADINIITNTDIDNWLLEDNLNKIDVDTVVLNEKSFEIGDYAFDGFISLNDVWYSGNITKIGNFAFRNCKLRSYMPLNNCTFIGQNAFENNTFQYIEIPAVSVIDNNAFKNCNELFTILLSDQSIVIKNSAFEGCSNLTELYNSQNIESIGDYAFKDCKLHDWISFQATSIGKNAFENNTFSQMDFRQITQFSDAMCKNCKELKFVQLPLIDTLNKQLFCGCEKLEAFENLQTIKNIGDYAFASCYNFPAKIELSSCTEIGRYAFLSCQNLSSLNAPNCTFVDYNAFYGTHLWDVDPEQQ